MKIINYKKIKKSSKSTTGVPRIVNFGIVFENVSSKFKVVCSKILVVKFLNLKKSKTFLIPKSTTGFAMLFAVLTASLLLTIGISIFNISLKELTISTNSRESQIAFFAADSARECALYWSLKVGVFQSYEDSSGNLTALPTGGIDYSSVKCNNLSGTLKQVKDLTNKTITYSQSSGNPSFILYGDALQPEASVIVTKRWDSASSSIITTIQGIGHNTFVSGRRVERSIEQTSIW